MNKLSFSQSTAIIEECSGEVLQTSHYVIETNRLSMMLYPQLNFILQQISLYFFRKNARCWIEQDYYHTATAFHLLVTERKSRNILWTEAFDFKSYVENMLGEPCMLCTGGAYYV